MNQAPQYLVEDASTLRMPSPGGNEIGSRICDKEITNSPLQHCSFVHNTELVFRVLDFEIPEVWQCTWSRGSSQCMWSHVALVGLWACIQNYLEHCSGSLIPCIPCILDWIWGETCSLRGCSGIGTGCPAQWWSRCPWQGPLSVLSMSLDHSP